MVNHRKIKSKFVKELAKKVGWKDKDYIDNFLFIECYITSKEPLGFSAAMKYHSLKGRYPKEIKAIGSELNPKEYRKY
jgi:hypothetical protein